MKSLIKLFFGIALVVLSIQSNVAQTTYSWVGGNGNWNLATNWSPNGVPTSSDNVLITTGGTYTVTLDVDATIADITVGGATGGFQAFLMNGRALTVNGTATISDSGKVSLTNSTVTGPGTLTNLGTMTVSGGTFNINIENEGLITFNGASSLNNDFSNQPNSTFIISSHYAAGATLKVVDGLTNNGMIEFVSSYPNSYGTLELTSGTLVNESGGTIQSSSGFSRIFAPLDNRGSMILNRNMEINKESATHSNSGSIEVNLGNFSLKQTGTDPSFTSTGTITVESARILTIDGGTFNFSSGNLDLKGSFSIEDAMINFTPAFINKEILSIKNSELTCGSSFTNQNKLTLTNSTINGGATFFNQDNVTVLNGIFNMNLDNAGSMTFNGLTSLNNDLMIQPNSTFIISSHYAAGAVLRVVDGLTNNGMIEFVSSYPNSYGTLELTSGTLVNEPGGTIQSSSGFSRIFAPLDNRGSMILNRNMEINKESAAHSNSGSITVSNGNLKLTQTGTDPSFTSTGTITVESARILTIDGGIFNFNSGNLDSNGSFIIEDATVNFTPTFISKGLFNLDNSSLTCGNGFTSQNKFTLKNSTISGGGTFFNQDEISVLNGIFNMNLDNAGIMTFRWPYKSQ